MTTALLLASFLAADIDARSRPDFCMDTLAQVTTDGSNACARCLDGRIFCAGRAVMELMDANLATDAPPVAWLEGITDARDVAMISDTVCVLRAGGRLHCRTNESEWFRDDDTVSFIVRGQGDEVAASVGFGQICMLRKSGKVLCLDTYRLWRLRSGNPREIDAVEVKGLDGVVQITAGFAHTCALKRDGKVACWGENLERQLGFDTKKRNPRAKRMKRFAGCADPCGCRSERYMRAFTYERAQDVPRLHDVAEVRAGKTATCARITDGKVWCWGTNSYGELGDGTEGDPDWYNDTEFGRATPAPVVGLSDAIALAMGLHHACAVRKTGELACWGSPKWGKSGILPAPVAGLPAASGVVTGSEAAFIQTRDGRWLHWGADFMRSKKRRTLKVPIPLLD